MRSVTTTCPPDSRGGWAPPQTAGPQVVDGRVAVGGPDVEPRAGEPGPPAAVQISPPPVRRRTTADRIVATPRMRARLTELVDEEGPHRVLVEWPMTARCVPAASHSASSLDVIIGHVASCPIFVDLQLLTWFFKDRVLEVDIDIEHGAVVDGTLSLLLNPAEARPLASNA